MQYISVILLILLSLSSSSIFRNNNKRYNEKRKEIITKVCKSLNNTTMKYKLDIKIPNIEDIHKVLILLI
jgi:hypothetical protein